LKQTSQVVHHYLLGLGPKILGSMSEGNNDMNGNTKILDQSDEDILTFETSDEALEAAAATTPVAAAAMSFPNAPTVSILVICCGNN
jgi:hypothetical protein